MSAADTQEQGLLEALFDTAGETWRMWGRRRTAATSPRHENELNRLVYLASRDGVADDGFVALAEVRP